ncbi:MAG: OmpA family protein [Deltaproteobacteria bacterium]|jgi:chemotaxis protein MotB|nr:OmpA family protein [Deltaproteobacteria bacterium]MBW2530072.1 OmpA family protein [Deltaproteobacteria bacterium]
MKLPQTKDAARGRSGWLRRHTPALVATLLLTLAAACVPRSEHESALADLQQSRTHAAALGRQLEKLEAEIAELKAAMKERDHRLSEAAGARAEAERQIEEVVALNAELGERLRLAGVSVEQLATEKGTLADALAKARRDLEELRRQQSAAEARSAQFKQLLAAFERMMDAGKLKVVLRDGRMLIELHNDVLFDSGRAGLKREGKATLGEVAKVLAKLEGRQFRVAGHTDNVQISSGRYPSNWELSTARAVEVVKFLIDRGMAPQSLSAAGYGEFAPATSNETPAGRAKNRRIEIELVPDLEEMVKLPAKTEAATQ